MIALQKKKLRYGAPIALIAMVMAFFWMYYPVFPNAQGIRYEQPLFWMMDAWNGEFIHGWAVPVLFIFFVTSAWKVMKGEPIRVNGYGLLVLGLGLLFFLIAVRTKQPRLAFFAIPYLILGSVLYVYGWKVARHMLFPSFFWYFAITLPGLQQATNGLQIAVTKSCYLAGSTFGMDLVLSGNNISSASDRWNTLNIAEGCSGIRSIIALVMISAIYAYFTQKRVWKMVFLFACALPIALLANFLRIFTIIVLAEMKFSHFAAGVYHDWAGLLFFFPVALSGLFLIDHLLNWKDRKKIVRRRAT